MENKDKESSEHNHREHHGHHGKHGRIYKFERFHTRSVLKAAFICGIMSTVVFVFRRMGFLNSFGSYMQNYYVLASYYVVAHLLAAFGIGTLLWSVISLPDGKGRRDKILCAAVISNVMYHLGAAIAFAVSFRFGFTMILPALWCVSALMLTYVFIHFIMSRNPDYEKVGVYLIIASIAGIPLMLPGSFAFIQWLVAKAANVALVIQLYQTALNIYYPKHR